MLVEDYLLCKWIGWGKVSITLAVDGGVTTSTNGIHLPVSVVIVYYMKIPMSAPAFFLGQTSFISDAINSNSL